MTEKFLSYQEAYTLFMNTQPLKFFDVSLEKSQLKFSDFAFNQSYASPAKHNFSKRFSFKKSTARLTKNFPQKYISPVPLYQLYREYETKSNEVLVNSDSLLKPLFTQEEVNNYKKPVHAVQCNKNKLSRDIVFVPTVNFDKRYSAVWQVDLNALDVSWIEAALLYYSTMEAFFESEHVGLYRSLLSGYRDETLKTHSMFIQSTLNLLKEALYYKT